MQSARRELVSTRTISSDTRRTHFLKILGAAVSTLLVLLPVRWQPGVIATNDPKTETVVDASGNLRVPGDYRTAYQSLGSWAVAADQGQGAKEIHVVYASPGAIAAYLKNGHFADGSVLVKEVFETTTGAMTEVSEGTLPRLIPAIAETDVVVTAFAPLLASMPAFRLVAAYRLLTQVTR
jgi:hypothetical protein